MKIKLNETTTIAGKSYPAGTAITVINDIGMRLVVTGKADCTDGTFATGIKIEKPKVIQKKKTPKK
jgi:hypothetical protein